jgi:hypothetical protein
VIEDEVVVVAKGIAFFAGDTAAMGLASMDNDDDDDDDDDDDAKDDRVEGATDIGALKDATDAAAVAGAAGRVFDAPDPQLPSGM